MPAIDKLHLNELINQAIKEGALAIYFNIGSYPVIKINDNLKDLTAKPILTKEFLNTIADSILSEEQKERLTSKKEITIAHNWSDDIRFLANFFYQKNSLSITIKLISTQIKDINDLNLPRVINDIIKLEAGLVIVCGPVSSGRSTTINSFIQYLNKNQEKRIISIEDPIEYEFIDDKSIIQQREVGQDVDSFLQGLADVVDEDVDIVYLSKINNAQEIKLAIQAAASGKLVLAVMDSNSVIVVLNKIYSSFKISEKELAKSMITNSLKVIINQRLIKKNGGGQILATEVFTMNDSSKSIIKSERFEQLNSVIQTSRGDNMQDLNSSLKELVSKGLINQEEAEKYITNANNF